HQKHNVSGMKAKSISSLVEGVIAKRKNANDLVLIIENITVTSKASLVLEAISGAHEIFVHLFESDNVSLQPDSDKCVTTTEKYKAWTNEQYHSYFDCLLACFAHGDQSVRKSALETCAKIIQCYGYYCCTSAIRLSVPEELVKKVTKCLLLQNECFDELLQLLIREFFKYGDIRYFVMRSLSTILSDVYNVDDQQKNNCLVLLESVTSLMPKEDSACLNSYILAYEKEIRDKFMTEPPFQISQHRKRFGQMWLEFLKLPLSGSHVKRVLVILHASLVPNFSQPRLLADFLINTYNRGGGLSLLSLHGLFVLMHNYNLDYPDFYTNLYTLLHPRIFSTKYKARFFHLLDLFLSSTHIPSYMVAAFVKKLSRLSLIAPPHSINTMVNMILNLMRRHPSIRHMIHCTDKEHATITTDPYIENEKDPALCKAAESSLWELHTLKHHYCPKIAKLASAKSLGTKETDIHENLEDNYKDFFDEVVKKEFKEIPMNYTQPNTLFFGQEDETMNLWTGI
uniref:CCAAT-binding factor domain-containing protein n=1 Tax=Ciona intestinalis TaxID=7719 RepID=F6TAD8_CIOIN